MAQLIIDFPDTFDIDDLSEAFLKSNVMVSDAPRELSSYQVAFLTVPEMKKVFDGIVTYQANQSIPTNIGGPESCSPANRLPVNWTNATVVEGSWKDNAWVVGETGHYQMILSFAANVLWPIGYLGLMVNDKGQVGMFFRISNDGLWSNTGVNVVDMDLRAGDTISMHMMDTPNPAKEMVGFKVALLVYKF